MCELLRGGHSWDLHKIGEQLKEELRRINEHSQVSNRDDKLRK